MKRGAPDTPTSQSATTQPGKAGPLAGIRILDMTSVMLGPYATQMLGDYGADIIKIEAPEGDTTRATGPALEPGMAAAFIGANRGKRSIVLDLKQAAARAALMVLIDSADVLIYSMRPQKLAALGLAPEVLRARNKALIVVAVHGFSERGPYAGRPAYDDIIQGLCGMAALSEMRGDAPAYMPSVVADKTCALFATQAVLIALVARGSSGNGTYVEVPMLECMVNFTLTDHFHAAHFRPPLGPPGYARLLTQWRKPYATSDGYVCILPYTDRHWHSFFTEAGRPEHANDPRFIGLAARTRNIDALYALAAECIATRSTGDWLAACDRLDIPAARLNRLADLEHDPHLAATGFFSTLEDPAMGTLVMPGAPLRFEGVTPSHGLPPRLGEHTVALLLAAGFEQLAIDALLASRAAVQKTPVETPT